MTGHQSDSAFVDTVPELYERLMVPMIFAEAADGLAREVARLAPADLLETAAGTGVLTRSLLARCPSTRIVATDLNEPMLTVAAAAVGAEDRVTFRRSDAQSLEFDDASFDVVACQFGVMFFPDRARAFGEARRVLRDGGRFVFSVWDSLATNDFARVVTDALLTAAPEQPLTFMERTPHGLHDEHLLRDELERAGFARIDVEWVEGVSRSTAADAAAAYCLGTPLRGMLDDHGSLDAARATGLAAAALAEHFGPDPIEGRIRSLRVRAS